jgi:hypothetical protein
MNSLRFAQAFLIAPCVPLPTLYSERRDLCSLPRRTKMGRYSLGDHRQRGPRHTGGFASHGEEGRRVIAALPSGQQIPASATDYQVADSVVHFEYGSRGGWKLFEVGPRCGSVQVGFVFLQAVLQPELQNSKNFMVAWGQC